jgi:7-cyano-7-deazaguanine synthase
MEEKEKGVIIVSGGADSITLLHYLHEQGIDLSALSFNYGSKHNIKEIPLAKYNCKKLGIEHNVIDLDLKKYFNSSLLQGDIDIPKGHYADNNMKSTVVPFRNGIMLSMAVGYAENNNSKFVYLGSHKGDRAQYPDCTSEFTKSMSSAAVFGTYNHIQIKSPFNDLMKWDVVRIGLELGVDYSKTWSCYEGKERPCLKCGTCVERIESFYRNDAKDPLLTNNEWHKGIDYMKKVLGEFDKK